MFEAIDYIGRSHYVNFNNTKIGGRKVNDHVLLSFVTSMVNGKHLIQGSYGQGKTTTSEAVGSVYFSLPIEYLSEGLLRCNPQKTEEKIYGRPDLGELSQGNEQVIWTAFSLSLVKILDEFNRLTKDKQTTLLDQIDRGIIAYLNEFFTLKTPIYATINQLDGGNTELLPAILDRFAITTIVTPPVGMMKSINGGKRLLCDSELTRELRAVLYKKGVSPLEKIQNIKGKSMDFYEKHKDSVTLFNQEDRDTISNNIKNMKISKGAENFIEYFFAEVNFDPENGLKGELKDADKNHYKDNISKSFNEQLSVRWSKNQVEKYAKALAWIKGEEEAGLKTLKFLIPYTIIHRINEELTEGDVLVHNKLRFARRLVDSVYDRFLTDSSFIDSFWETLGSKEIDKINGWSESDHPYFEYYKALFIRNLSDKLVEA